MKYSIFTVPPKDFAVALVVAGCYCEYQDTLLFLKRHSSHPQGGTWGIPSGKQEKGESPRQTVAREVHEEVGISISDDAHLQELGTLYVRLPHVDYIYHMFRKRFTTLPELILSEEHVEAQWLTLQQALQLQLITGGKEALEYYRKFLDL